MSLSVTDNRKSIKKNVIVWSCTALFCGIFSAVYECFSHGVYSPFMVWLFAIPLLGGAVPYFILLLKKGKTPVRAAMNLYNSGIATLCVGSCLRGVTDIYGTQTVYEPVYWTAGILLIIIPIIMTLFKPAR